MSQSFDQALYQSLSANLDSWVKDSIAENVRANPWHPILMEWAVEHYAVHEGEGYDPDFLSTHYQLPLQKAELKPRASTKIKPKPEPYVGSTILTPAAEEQQRRKILKALIHEIRPRIVWSFYAFCSYLRTHSHELLANPGSSRQTRLKNLLGALPDTFEANISFLFSQLDLFNYYWYPALIGIRANDPQHATRLSPLASFPNVSNSNTFYGISQPLQPCSAKEDQVGKFENWMLNRILSQGEIFYYTDISNILAWIFGQPIEIGYNSNADQFHAFNFFQTAPGTYLYNAGFVSERILWQSGDPAVLNILSAGINQAPDLNSQLTGGFQVVSFRYQNYGYFREDSRPFVITQDTLLKKKEIGLKANVSGIPKLKKEFDKRFYHQISAKSVVCYWFEGVGKLEKGSGLVFSCSIELKRLQSICTKLTATPAGTLDETENEVVTVLAGQLRVTPEEIKASLSRFAYIDIPFKEVWDNEAIFIESYFAFNLSMINKEIFTKYGQGFSGEPPNFLKEDSGKEIVGNFRKYLKSKANNNPVDENNNFGYLQSICLRSVLTKTSETSKPIAGFTLPVGTGVGLEYSKVERAGLESLVELACIPFRLESVEEQAQTDNMVPPIIYFNQTGPMIVSKLEKKQPAQS